MDNDWWAKPFSFEFEGQPWAILTDKVVLIALQQESSLPKLDADQEDVRQIQRMLSIQPKTPPQVTGVQRLKNFLATDDYATILGIPVGTVRLIKALTKLKQPEVGLWDASSPFLVHTTLGLVAQGGKWKAFLMGVKNSWTDLPVYEFEPPVEPEPEFDVFTELGS